MKSELIYANAILNYLLNNLEQFVKKIPMEFMTRTSFSLIYFLFLNLDNFQ